MVWCRRAVCSRRCGVGRDLDVCVDGIRGFDPDVVLLDIHLPDGCGEEVVHRVRAVAGPRPVILAFSGNCDAGDVNLVGINGLDGFLAKPIRREALRAAVAEALRRVRVA